MLAAATTLGLALPTTVWMINRVSRHATGQRANSKPASPARLAQHQVLPLSVPDFTNGCEAVLVNFTNLARRKPKLSITPIDRHQSCKPACGPNQLRTSAWKHFHAVNISADRNAAQRQGITN